LQPRAAIASARQCVCTEIRTRQSQWTRRVEAFEWWIWCVGLAVNEFRVCFGRGCRSRRPHASESGCSIVAKLDLENVRRRLPAGLLENSRLRRSRDSESKWFECCMITVTWTSPRGNPRASPARTTALLRLRLPHRLPSRPSRPARYIHPRHRARGTPARRCLKPCLPRGHEIRVLLLKRGCMSIQCIREGRQKRSKHLH
jgi:hypothetical protein